MKIQLVTMVVVSFFVVAFAELSVGVKGGLSYFRCLEEGSGNYYNKFHWGPAISVFCEKKQNRYLFHDFQINYYHAGGRTVYFPGANVGNLIVIDEIKGSMDLQYAGGGYAIRIKPVSSAVSPYMSAGISLDFLVGNKERLKEYEFTEDESFFPYSEVNKLTLRPHATAGFEFAIIKKVFFLLDYTFSFNVIPFKRDKNFIGYDVDHFTFGSFFSIGLRAEL